MKRGINVNAADKVFDNTPFLIIAIIVLLIVVLVWIVKLNIYIHQQEYIKIEMNRSHSKKEYEYWERKLKRCRLKLIPIVGYFIKTKSKKMY